MEGDEMTVKLIFLKEVTGGCWATFWDDDAKKRISREMMPSFAREEIGTAYNLVERSGLTEFVRIAKSPQEGSRGEPRRPSKRAVRASDNNKKDKKKLGGHIDGPVENQKLGGETLGSLLLKHMRNRTG
jgi:hypothetical protein